MKKGTRKTEEKKRNSGRLIQNIDDIIIKRM